LYRNGRWLRICWLCSAPSIWIYLSSVEVKGKSKFVPIHAMKAYRGRKGTTPLILNLGVRWRWVFTFMPQWMRFQCPFNRRLGPAPHPVSTFWRTADRHHSRHKSVQQCLFVHTATCFDWSFDHHPGGRRACARI
jgi:hypothetical protein